MVIVRILFVLGGWLAPEATIRQAARLLSTPRPASRTRARIAPADDAQLSTLVHGSDQLAIYTWGNPAVQPYVLLAHGWSSYALRFLPWVAGLRKAGYAVVAFDQPAHGLSTGTHANPLVFADKLAAVAQHFGPAHAIVAHSLGGAAATLALARGLAVQRVVLIAPAADPVAMTRRFARLIGLAERLRRRLVASFDAVIPISFAEQQVHRNAPAIARPLLVIHDLADREVPWDEGERYVRHWPGARLLTTQGLDHHRIVCAPAVIAAALQFIDGAAVGERVVSSPNLPYGVA